MQHGYWCTLLLVTNKTPSSFRKTTSTQHIKDACLDPPCVYPKFSHEIGEHNFFPVLLFRKQS